MFASLQEFFQSHLGYPEIFLMMTIESSFIPFPSEAALIPAGILIAQGTLDWVPSYLSATAGVLIGATINYIIGMTIGRAFIEKYGKYFFIKQELYQQAESLFQKNAIAFTFFGRLIPGIRQLISIPAGIFRMHFLLFLSLTMIGSSIWTLFLLSLGYLFGENTDLIKEYTLSAMFLILGIVVIYILLHIFLMKRSKALSETK